MGVPDRYLPHDVVLVEPAETVDGYGNTVHDWATGTRTTVRGWVQQNQRTLTQPDGRSVLEQRWLLVTNAAVPPVARVEWAGPSGQLVFETDGPPGPVFSPDGLHHTEATLRVVDG